VIHYFLALLAALGFLDSIYTALQQKYPNLFEFCFSRNLRKRVGCYEILHSSYASVFFGIPNSWLGVAAYALLTILFLNNLLFLALLVTSTGFLFSIYLLSVQAHILKKFCIFCLFSTALITLLMILLGVSVL